MNAPAPRPSNERPDLFDELMRDTRALGRRAAIVGAVGHVTFGAACGLLTIANAMTGEWMPTVLFGVSWIATVGTLWLDFVAWLLNQEPDAHKRLMGLPLARGGIELHLGALTGKVEAPGARMVYPRWLARWWARSFGYFWLPCPICKEPFAGFEWGSTVVERGRTWGVCAKPECIAESAKRNAAAAGPHGHA
jgi:hypothetical protein